MLNLDKNYQLGGKMDIEKMGGADVYVKYLALMKRSYLLTPFSNKHTSSSGYYAVDGAANWGHDIFHYCQKNILEDIINSKRLRFSDIRFLRDKTEFKEAVRILRMAVERKKSSMDKELYDILTDGDVFNKIKSYSQHYSFSPPIDKNREIDSIKPICKVYTCSFCMKGDLISMWDDYAKGPDGVSINFTELKDHMKPTEKVKIVWGKIWYTEEDKSQCVEALLEDVTKLFSEIPDKKCREEMILDVLINVINNMRIFMKKQKFEKEKEYRATLIVPEKVINKNELPIGYKQDIFKQDIPCIDVPFDLESINNIIINPDGDFDLIKTCLEDYLQKQNLNHVKIWKSSIPMRKY